MKIIGPNVVTGGSFGQSIIGLINQSFYDLVNSTTVIIFIKLVGTKRGRSKSMLIFSKYPELEQKTAVLNLSEL